MFFIDDFLLLFVCLAFQEKLEFLVWGLILMFAFFGAKLSKKTKKNTRNVDW